MVMPSFIRHLNKRFFNRLELANGRRPVIAHIGRTSGFTYRTPLEALPIEGGYAFVLVYGSDHTDWVKNILAAGRAVLTVDGNDHELVNPRVESGEQAWDLLPDTYRRPPGFLNVTEVLLTDLSG